AGWPNEWRSRLIWGDNKYVLSSLLEEFAGKIDLVYIDPPFATGQDFTVQLEVGDEQLVKRASLLEEKAYRDTWGRGHDSYLQMMYERLTMLHELLAPSGTLYVHCDRRVNYMLRAILDEMFGADNLRNEIIWCYRGGGTPEKDFAEKHDTIL